MKNLILLVTALTVIACTNGNRNSHISEVGSEDQMLVDNTIINLYDAFSDPHSDLELKTDFGFSCIIRFNGKTILFDSGTNADIFKKNVEALNLDLAQVDYAIASHAHFDHINGFDYLLQVNPDVKIYFPFDMFWGANVPFDLSGAEDRIVDSLEERMQYFTGKFDGYRFNQTGRFWNANIEFVRENVLLEEGIRLIATSSPFMGMFNKYPRMDNEPGFESSDQDLRLQPLPELSLSLETPKGEVLIVGCSHSTVEKIIEETISYTRNEIALVFGGYHLLPYDRNALLGLSRRLKEGLGVKRLAPAHCTGHLAFKILRDAYQDDYIYAGLGEVVKF